MRLVGKLSYLQQVIAVEGMGGLPLLAILVAALEGDVEHAPSLTRGVGPDGALDQAQPDFMHGTGIFGSGDFLDIDDSPLKFGYSPSSGYRCPPTPIIDR